MRAGSTALVTIAAGLAIASCRTPANVTVSWTLAPSTPVVGPSVLTVMLRDPSGAAVTGAKVRLEAHMTHPGMTPVTADAAERSQGVYVAAFAFTMPGDWVLLVSAALSNGGRVEQRIDVANVGPSR